MSDAQTFAATPMRRFEIMRSHLKKSLVAAALTLVAGCAVEIPSEDKATSTESASTLSQGGDEVVNKSCDDSLALDAAKLICKIVGYDANLCTIKNYCRTHAKEVFTGATLRAPAAWVSGQKVATNGFGAHGRKMAQAGLCILKHLQKGEIVTSPPGLAHASVKQTIGFEHFDAASQEVRGYRRLTACLDVFGCIDSRAQEFTAKIVQSPETTLSSGQMPEAAAYALAVTTDEYGETIDVKIPGIKVETPVGPIDVTPEFIVEEQSMMSHAPFDGSFTAWSKDLASPDWTPTPIVAVLDLYGRDVGAKITAAPPQGPWKGGWDSQIGLGGRFADNVWTPSPFTQTPMRPDLDPTVPRSAQEKVAGIHLGASAHIEYGPLTLLPDFWTSNDFFSIKFKIYVTPKFDASYGGQLGMLFGEAATPTHSLTSYPFRGGPQNLSQVFFENGAAAKTSISVDAGMDLSVVFHFFGKHTLIDIHPSFNVPVWSEGTSSKGASAHASIRTDGDPAIIDPVRPPPGNLGAQSNGPTFHPAPWVDEGHFEELTTMHNPEDPNAFISACFATPAPDQKPATPAYSEGSPAGWTTGALFPCNICVGNDAVSQTDPNTNVTKSVPAIVTSVMPSTTPNPKWTCTPARFGCMDMCSFDPATKKLVVVDSASDFGSSSCKGFKP